MRAATTKAPSGRKQRASDVVREVLVAPSSSGESLSLSSGEDLHARIAQRAYELHLARGGQHGHALEDWLEAEQEILGANGQA